MDVKELLKSVPGSYDDFVYDTADWMSEDSEIYAAIMNQLRINPQSNTDDLTRVLWKCLGIGEPLELIDDEDEDGEEFSEKVMKVEPGEGTDDSQEERVSGRKGVRVAMM